MNKKTSRKLIPWMLLVFTVTTVLVGCSGNNNNGETSGSLSPTAGNQEEAAKPITIRIGTFDDPFEQETARAVAELYVKDNPHVTIKIEPYVGDPKTKVLAQAASGDLPDVTWLADGYVKEFAEAGVLEPLDGYLEENNVDVNDIYPAMLGYGIIDGQTYMLPRDYNHIVFYANTTLLAQEGLTLPENGWTWDTFMEYSDKLTKKDTSGKTTQWAVSLNPTAIGTWMACAQGRGGQYLNKEEKTVNFSDPKVVAGLRDCWDLVKNGNAQDPMGQYSEDPFYAGKTAFMAGAKPFAAGIHAAAEAKGFEWDVTTFPQFPVKAAVGTGTSGYGVSAKSKHKKEAAGIVAMFVKQVGQIEFGKTGNAVPVLKSMESDTTWRDNPVPGKNTDAFVAFPENDVLREHELVLSTSKANTINLEVGNAFTKYMLGAATLEDALKEVDEKANAAE
ncbi:ABC transporter substrate-binding protein [Paenibacillus sp. PAMC21692]|uniref:ABC transporter substrate-binding protein n=1 Tax=Paenibacillus sp. PAMC21692 TaxID=2762320 RepID=UPI00164D30D6|nr:sugar ABC transporter substrate-binding protein [Paenibacillus sp. PAMC21692]QNK59521.1 sugar ABC transporter substrate-binding protein [Paenibacillus sp. PAMC21692]